MKPWERYTREAIMGQIDHLRKRLAETEDELYRLKDPVGAEIDRIKEHKAAMDYHILAYEPPASVPQKKKVTRRKK